MNILLIIVAIFILLSKNLLIKEKIFYLVLFLLFVFILNKSDNKIKHLEINKTFYINRKSKNQYVNYFADTLKYVLENRNWRQLNENEILLSDNIGFSFTNDKNITLKSDCVYKLYTQTYNILINKIKLRQKLEDTKYSTFTYILNKNDLLNNIDHLFFIIKDLKDKEVINKDTKLILKDPLGSLGKQVILVNEYDNTDKYKKFLLDFIKRFKSNNVLIEEFHESIKIKIPKYSFNYNRINHETEFGRRSLIRFFIAIIVNNNRIEFYKINNYATYLTVLPSFGNILDDIKYPGTYITNYYLNTSSSVLENEKNILSKNLYKNVEVFKNISNGNFIGKYPSELFSKLFCIPNNLLKKKLKDKFNILENEIDNFIKVFADKYHDEFVCKNDCFFNKNFNSCFNILAVDSIFTTNNELKILEINNNSGNFNLKYFDKNKYIFNCVKILDTIFDKIEYGKFNKEYISLITSKKKIKYKKSYFLSKKQIELYTEIINVLKKRKYLRSMWRPEINSNNDISLYIGYIPINEHIHNYDKQIYLDYLNRFLSDYSITNKITGSIFELGDKSTLYDNLKNSGIISDFVNFKLLKDMNGPNFVSTNDLNKIKEFIESKKNKCNRYILKPSLGSQGQGIKIIKTFEDFNQWYRNEKTYNDWTISNFLDPKLFYSKKIVENNIGKRKAHLRVYFIIIRDKFNKTKIYELNNKIIYFAVDKYIDECVNIDNNNKYSFITNLALASEERNINYDMRNYSDKLNNYKDDFNNYDLFLNKLTEYGLQCINLLTGDLLNCLNKDNSKFKGCYHILAIDYLPTGNNEVKVLEVNKGPGFKGLKINFDLENIFDEFFTVSIDYLNGISYSDSNLKLLRRIQ